MRIWSILLSRAKKLLISVILVFVTCGTLQAKRFVDASRLEAAIIQNEGVSSFVYVDIVGHYTVGIGRNLDKRGNNGLTEDEMLYLLRNDIRRCQKSLEPYPWYSIQNEPRKDALIELCFNMGMPRLLKFRNTLRFMGEKNYDEAAKHLLMSKWSKQVGPTRSKKISEQIRRGRYV